MYGDGHCAVCGHKVRPDLLMCGVDWRKVPRPLQRRVYDALAAYQVNQLTLGELRDVQDVAVLAAGGQPAVDVL